jgi:hypothetical protein
MAATNPCRECNQSPWVQAAQNYVNNNAANPSKQTQVATLNFLLGNGYCGKNHRTSIDAIITALHLPLDREQFQQQILNELKTEGALATYVYPPGGGGGVFIPCNAGEIHEVTSQMFDRILSELRNLEGSTTGSDDHAKVEIFRKIAEAFKESM